MRRAVVVALVLSIGAVSGTAWAAGKAVKRGPNAGKAKTEGQGSAQVARLSLAVRLADTGRALRSPDALIAAADLTLRVARPAATRLPKTVLGSAPKKVTPRAAQPDRYSVPALLADARKLAAGNKALLARIGQLAAGHRRMSRLLATRGPVKGLIVHRDRVFGRTTDRYRVVLRGRERARIMVRGDGVSDLDCTVHDDNRNLIDSDRRSADRCYLTFTPLRTGVFVIRIKNLGRVHNRYTMIVGK